MERSGLGRGLVPFAYASKRGYRGGVSCPPTVDPHERVERRMHNGV